MSTINRRRLIAATVASVIATQCATRVSRATESKVPSAPDAGRIARIKYPLTRTTNAVDRRVGVEFPNPYSWLEGETEEVHQWQRAQAEVASDFTHRWPHYESLEQGVEYFSSARFDPLPRLAGGRWFRMRTLKGARHAQVVVADAPLGHGRILFDPVSENADKPPFLSWISPSPDGRKLALGVGIDSSEKNVIRLIDVATGKLLPGAPPQVLMDNWLGGVQWLVDSSGFFYTALVGTTDHFQQRIFLHRIGAPAPTEPIDLPLLKDSSDYSAVTVSRDGRWAIVMHRLANPTPVALLDLTDPKGKWRPFITEVAGTVAGYVVDDRYIAVTDVDAARGRVVAIPLDSNAPNNAGTWSELVPESNAVIRGVKPIGNKLYVNELVDTYARVSIFDLSGQRIGEVPLPGKGVVEEPASRMTALLTGGNTHAFLFGFSTLVSSWGVYLHEPDGKRVKTLIEPEITIENARIEDHWATSADGTKIPYHTVRLNSVDASKPQPTLIHAYGGFGAPFLPQFLGPMATFVAAGGICVHAHLRGGGELGLQWWQQARLKSKQNSYADLYAVAEDLIARGTSKRELLGVTGSSNGGLMAGVALTQRPDLWRVVIPRVPLSDLIGALRESYGHFVVNFEFGDPSDPAEVRRIATFSPCQLVKQDTSYPAVYLSAGAADPRCPPWHSRKLAAALQAAQGGHAPILLHVWDNAGHGAANAKDTQIAENTAWLAFALQCLGMTPPPRQPHRSALLRLLASPQR